MESRSNFFSLRLATAAALCLFLTASALAQAPAGPQPAPPGQSNPAPSAPSTQKEQAPQQKPQESGVTISVEVPVVTLDVIATTQHGDLLTGLKKENFRVLEDGQPQTITNFGPTDAPITMVILMEFSARGYNFFAYEAKYWADALFPNLKQKDWVALVTFDMRPRMEADFTQNKDEVRQKLYSLYFPGFSESNVFDALLDTVDRLKDVKGKKSVLLLASGVDTFSKHTLDQTLKQLRGTDVTVFAVGVAKPLMNWLELHGRLGGTRELGYLQAENQLKTFAQMTGGFAWFPQFDSEIPGVMRDVTEFLRHQYSITYSPTNRSSDGKYRKIKVELVAPDGSPLSVVDQKGKKQKWVVYAKEGYTAPKGGVGD
ncbi:MAG TPA: VWA domain-containing protein [Candidatus Limnocylindrales bacterium]|nr:VWA domain-containing protein [Candidatus Limnocylindrales bacterium]